MAKRIQFSAHGGPEVLEYVDYTPADPGPQQVPIHKLIVAAHRKILTPSHDAETGHHAFVEPLIQIADIAFSSTSWQRLSLYRHQSAVQLKPFLKDQVI